MSSQKSRQDEPMPDAATTDEQPVEAQEFVDSSEQKIRVVSSCLLPLLSGRRGKYGKTEVAERFTLALWA